MSLADAWPPNSGRPSRRRVQRRNANDALLHVERRLCICSGDDRKPEAPCASSALEERLWVSSNEARLNFHDDQPFFRGVLAGLWRSLSESQFPRLPDTSTTLTLQRICPPCGSVRTAIALLVTVAFVCVPPVQARSDFAPITHSCDNYPARQHRITLGIMLPEENRATIGAATELALKHAHSNPGFMPDYCIDILYRDTQACRACKSPS